MSTPIFISHSSKDKKIARTICDALEERGLACWIASRNVSPGGNYQEEIVLAIRAAKAMVLVFTANSNTSDEVKKELALASKYKLVVIPARVEDVLPSAAFELEFATRQWFDLFEAHQIGELAAHLAVILSIEPPRPRGARTRSRKPPVREATDTGGDEEPSELVWRKEHAERYTTFGVVEHGHAVIVTEPPLVRRNADGTTTVVRKGVVARKR